MMRNRTPFAHCGRTLLVAVLALILSCIVAYVLIRRVTPRPRHAVAGGGPAPAPAGADPAQIVPGRQIGPISIGMTQEDVTRALGAPDEVLNRMWSWKDPQMSAGFGPDGRVAVVLAAGVGATAKQVPFRSADGIGFGATADQVIVVWGAPDNDHTEPSPTGVSRALHYTARGIQLRFSNGKLTWLSVRRTPAATRPG